MNTIPDDIDFDAYLKGPDEGAMVLPAVSWVDEVIDAIERPQGQGWRTDGATEAIQPDFVGHPRRR